MANGTLDERSTAPALCSFTTAKPDLQTQSNCNMYNKDLTYPEAGTMSLKLQILIGEFWTTNIVTGSTPTAGIRTAICPKNYSINTKTVLVQHRMDTDGGTRTATGTCSWIKEC